MARSKKATSGGSTRLKYVGPEARGFVPLPEGWPAADHDEPDEAVRAEKLASQMYDIERAEPEEAHAPWEV